MESAFSHGFRPDHTERLLHDYFAAATESFARFPDSADDVPIGLATTRWSWDGPVD